MQKEKESSSNPGNILSQWIFCSSRIDIIASLLLTNLPIILGTVHNEHLLSISEWKGEV